MMFLLIALLSFVFALIPCVVFWRNLTLFCPLPPLSENATELPAVSLLIPARNEAHAIEDCVRAALDNPGLTLEVVVLDDQSEDGTGEIVSRIAAQDHRVRLESARALPSGWCGKQHACAQLAELARYELMLFIDADVRLASGGVSRMVQQFHATDVDLLSGFPRQITRTLAESLLIPLIHFVLLGFLSIKQMRQSRSPAFGAGCGQLFLTHRAAYRQAGGHEAIKASLHDGIKLPRQYRSHDLVTDLFDATDVATCRMYVGAEQVWNGLLKNATEGVANAKLIVPVSLLLIGGQVVPFLLPWLLVARGEWGWNVTSIATVLAMFCSWMPRFVGSYRFRQSPLGALLHPLGIVAFLAIQWTAFARSFSKRPVQWKGRPYPAI